MEFIKWIPTRIKTLQNKSPEEIAMTLNKLSKTPEGQKQLEILIQEFKSENTAIQPEEPGMFKKGGKLDYLISKFQNGGQTKQRHSDLGRKDFHGVDLFPYGPNSRKTSKGYIDRPLAPGVNKTTLPNGVGLRQITRNNITTSELVSPDKKDTLYIHNGVGGRVDSNIDDSGFLGFLGLKKSSPVSGCYKYLQEKFNTQKFEKGNKITSRVTTHPNTWDTKTDSNGVNYYVMPADTVGTIVHRAVARETSSNSQTPGLVITEQVQTVGDPKDTQTRTNTRTYENIKSELAKGNPLISNWFETKLPSGWLSKLFKQHSEEDKKIFELYDIK